MKTHSLFLIPLLLLACVGAYAQEAPDEVQEKFIMPLNYTVIKQQAQNDEIYGELISKFEANDAGLGVYDIAVAYYGWAFRPGYKGNLDAERSPVEGLVAEGKYAAAWNEGLAYLKDNPVSLVTLRYTIEAGKAARKPEADIERLQWRHDMILIAINYTGDGYTEQTAYRVISKTDEFIFMENVLGVQSYAGRSFLPTYVSRYDVVRADNFDRSRLYMDSGLANHFGPKWEPQETPGE